MLFTILGDFGHFSAKIVEFLVKTICYKLPYFDSKWSIFSPTFLLQIPTTSPWLKWYRLCLRSAASR
jgi:hypothetical protein